MIQAYRLQLANYWKHGKPLRYIITGDEWFKAGLAELVWKKGDKPEFLEWTGLAIIYPEHDLLWIGVHDHKTERFKTFENFKKEFITLPRWEATRYAVVEQVNNFDPDDYPRIVDYALFLFDCRTGQRLIDDEYPHKPVPGREAEVARLRRGIEQLMRGEAFSFM